MEAFLFGVASNVVASVIVKVGTLLFQNAEQAAKYNAVDEVNKLEGELKKAQRLFDGLRTTDIWQGNIADVLRVFYDIEDLVDDLIVDDINSSLRQKIKKPFKGKSGSSRRKIKEVRERLEGIICDLKLENKTQQQVQQCHCQHDAKKVPEPALDEFLGRKEEKEEVIRLLLDDNITSVNIVGIGGLGKTALAVSVKSDPRIKRKFHRIRWVPVSAEFDLKAVAGFVLKQRLESFQRNKIRRSFDKMRAGKSSLIVLDGLQDVTNEDWRSFSSVFLPPNTGCKVLITTHNPWVAVKTEATLYHLPLMRDEDCQSLVIERALSSNRLDGRQRLIVEKNVGAITKKSKGLPLAASILGWYLPSKCHDNDWINNDIYDMKEFKEEIFPKFNLNTASISSDVKRCLAYCSLFPRNHDFKRDTLVELWMAEGFIQPQGKRSLRQIGVEYINDLYGKSFFQPSSDIGEHEISSYKIHEFIHGFAELVASDICFRLEDINDFSSDLWCKKVRHLSLLCTSVQSYLKKIEECDGLRTFLLPSKHQMLVGQIPYSFFEKLRRLRVLDLSHTDVIKIPGSLGILKHLRYLDLADTRITELPSISKLLQLQVLKLTGCPELLQLPTDLYTLTSLVHLDVDIQGLPCMPARVGSLVHLQTLPIFFVGDREGYRITELQNLKQLCGTLNLVGLEKIRDEAEAREAKLCEKESLRRLELEWSNFTDGARAVDVFTGLEPSFYVKELKVTHYAGCSFPTWLTSPLCILESIQVKDCLLDDVLPTLGQLPCLKNLHLEGMHCVTLMRNPVCRDGSGRAFPSLESLNIKNMMHLTHWHEFPDNCMLKLNKLIITDCEKLSSTQSLNSINSLQTLEINRCPVLEALPDLPPSVQSLIIIESDMVNPEWYKIKSIPSVEIDGNKIDFR